MPVDVVIAGAGFAGASTAYHLSRRYRGRVLLVERERRAGVHASGRNARLVLQHVDDPGVRALLVESRRAYEPIAADIGFRQTGSVLLGSAGRIENLTSAGLSHEVIESDFLGNHPVLAEYPVQTGIFTPSDGVVDIGALLKFYLDGACERGVEVRFDCPLAMQASGSQLAVRVGGEELQAGIVVNACGAWADIMARSGGIESTGLRPLKRHLFVVENEQRPDPELPFAWDLEVDFYLRPEGAGWLISLCEELEGRFPDDATVEPPVSGRLHHFLKRLPTLERAMVTNAWSCFRTYPSEGTLQLGWDPHHEGLFWVAGLGGHGMGSSWEVGRLAATRLLERL